MVIENINTASSLAPLTSGQTDTINNIMAEKKELAKLYCPGCRYCMPHCPQKVNIEYIFQLYNDYKIYGAEQHSKAEYASLEKYNTTDASHCIECGICEEKCPQHLKIIDKLKECHELLKT